MSSKIIRGKFLFFTKTFCDKNKATFMKQNNFRRKIVFATIFDF